MGSSIADVTASESQHKETYHHGSVETSAIDAATEIVRTSGAAALTVRDVSAAIGVTHAALYRHIKSRGALLDRVAARWLDNAADRINGAACYAEVIDRYVRWALESEPLYRCAFELDPTINGTAPAALGRLRVLVAEGYRNDLGGTGDEVRDGVLATWGQAHGLVDLYWKRLLRAADNDRAAEYITGLVQISKPAQLLSIAPTPEESNRGFQS